MSSIDVEAVSFGFRARSGEDVRVFDKFSASFAPATLTAIMGRSGSGKTTLLNLIAGIHQPQQGVIRRGVVRGSHVGYVFQHPTLIPWRTVRQNALYGAEVAGLCSEQVRQRVEGFLGAYNLAEVADAFPQQLSGGMQQRLAMIRAVVAGGDAILLDEPFSSSDVHIRRELHNDLSTLVRSEKLTAILVTHDIYEALALADHVLLLVGDRPVRSATLIDVGVSWRNRVTTSGRLAPALAPLFDQIWHSLTTQTYSQCV